MYLRVVSLLLAAVAASCANGPHGAAIVAAAQQAPLEFFNKQFVPSFSGQYLMSVQVLASATGIPGRRALLPHESLHWDDRLELWVTVAHPAYIYVLDVSTVGRAKLIYPARYDEELAPHPAGPLLRVPPGDGALQMDSQCQEQRLIVMARSVPLDTKECEQLGVSCSATVGKVDYYRLSRGDESGSQSSKGKGKEKDKDKKQDNDKRENTTARAGRERWERDPEIVDRTDGRNVLASRSRPDGTVLMGLTFKCQSAVEAYR